MTTASDGYSNVSLRDTTHAVGGIRGHVNTTTTTKTVVGKGVEAFEWAHLCILDNYADNGENVALYAQSNKHGTGPTWGACIETCDLTPDDKSSIVGAEIDCWVSGKDTGLRYGIDVVIGDSQLMRGMSASDVVEGTAGIRIGPSSIAPSSKWNTGIELTGNMGVGIDLSNCKAEIPIKLPNGQTIGKRDPLLYFSIVISIISAAASLIQFVR